MKNELKKAIKDQKKTIKEVAALLGCSRQTLANFLNNKGTINSDLFIKLIDLLRFRLCIVVI